MILSRPLVAILQLKGATLNLVVLISKIVKIEQQLFRMEYLILILSFKRLIIESFKEGSQNLKVRKYGL